MKTNSKFFKDIPTIKFEGKESKNPFAFKYYNAKKKVGKKTMEEHLRYAVAYWHTFCGTVEIHSDLVQKITLGFSIAILCNALTIKWTLLLNSLPNLV